MARPCTQVNQQNVTELQGMMLIYTGISQPHLVGRYLGYQPGYGGGKEGEDLKWKRSLAWSKVLAGERNHRKSGWSEVLLKHFPPAFAMVSTWSPPEGTWGSFSHFAMWKRCLPAPKLFCCPQRKVAMGQINLEANQAKALPGGYTCWLELRGIMEFHSPQKGFPLCLSLLIFLDLLPRGAAGLGTVWNSTTFCFQPAAS